MNRRNTSLYTRKKRKQHAGKVIGQGSYGCVLSPPLECEEPNLLQKGYVSKFMEVGEANSELKEFRTINKLDPTERYHLGKPIMCRPKNTVKNKNELKKCNNNPKTASLNRYRILLLKNGGTDLDKFCQQLPKSVNSAQFWNSAQQIVTGLYFFEKKHICHHDIKPSNIVYSPITKKMVFIDFGLMNSFRKIIEEANRSLIHGRFHWSYPLDYLLLNKNIFQSFVSLSLEKRQTMSNKFIRDFMNNKNDLFSSFDTTFYYFYGNQPFNKEAHLRAFFDCICKETITYSDYLQRTIQSIDSYAIGMTLSYAVNRFYESGKISQPVWNFGIQLFREEMGNWNPKLRNLNFTNILSKYQTFLSLIATTPNVPGPLAPKRGGNGVNTVIKYADIDPMEEKQKKEWFDNLLINS
jgi:serine/threonine protein kinase